MILCFILIIIFFRKPTRPSLPLKKESFESLRLPLAKGSSTSNQAFLLRRKDVNRPPVLGTAALYGWRTIKGLRHIVRDGTAFLTSNGFYVAYYYPILIGVSPLRKAFWAIILSNPILVNE